jgi:hypothetical protein
MNESGRYAKNKLPLKDMAVAVQGVARSRGGPAIDEEELECIIAVLIQKGYVKGYLSHRPLFLVLSNKMPFPKISDVKVT